MKLLVETMAFSPIPYDGGKLFTEAVDDRPGKYQGTTVLKVRGVSQQVGIKNVNNRIYPESLWAKVLADDSGFMQRIKEGAVAGQIEHPESGNTTLDKISHRVDRVWREGENICAEYTIFATPDGLKLQELYRNGFPCAVSSRGRGETRQENGVDIVEDGFQMDTFDFVYDPSVRPARPKPVKENVSHPTVNNHQESRVMNEKAARMVGQVRESARRISEGVKSAKSIKDLVALSTQVQEQQDKIASIDAGDAGTALAELSGQLTSIQQELSGRMVKVAEDGPDPAAGDTAPNAGAAAPPAATDPGKTGDDTVPKCGTCNGPLDANGKCGKCDIEPQPGAAPGGPGADGTTVPRATLERRYNAAIAVIEDIRDRYLKLEKDHSGLVERHKAALRLVQEMMEQAETAKKSAYVQQLVASNPSLKKIESKLMAQASVKDIQTLVEEVVKPLADGVVREPLPPSGSTPPSGGNSAPSGTISESKAPRMLGGIPAGRR